MLNTLAGIIASSGGAAAGGDYESIATVTVGGGGSSSITFSSIPSTYTHLQIRALMLTTSAANIVTRFNSDNGTNYAYHELTGSGATAAASGASSTGSPYSGYTSTQPGVMIQDVLDYANTNKYKTNRILTGSDANGSGYVIMRSNLWQNTAAINRIDITASGGANFNQYSSFALYGIKG